MRKLVTVTMWLEPARQAELDHAGEQSIDTY